MGPTYRRCRRRGPAPGPRVAGGACPWAASLSPVRIRLLLGMWAAIALVVALTVVANEMLDIGGADDQVVSGPDGQVGTDEGAATSTTTPGGSVVPAPGQLHVTGMVAVARAEGALPEPREVPAPLTISSVAGFGNGGEITLVTVDGVESTIVWDGGRPFVLSSGAGLVLDPGVLDVGPEGARFVLGGGVHRISPGTYRLDAPVAVGSQGIATPRDGVTFEAGPDAAFEARGDASLPLAAEQPHRFVGPGTVHLEGTFEVTDSTGTRAATVVDLAEGPFELTLEPVPEGWRITAVLQGETTAS